MKKYLLIYDGKVIFEHNSIEAIYRVKKRLQANSRKLKIKKRGIKNEED